MTPSQHRLLQLVQLFRTYVPRGHGALHATHGWLLGFKATLLWREDPAAAAEWTQLTSTDNINAFVKITEHLYSIFARNINKKGWSSERGVYLPCIFILGLGACERRKSKEKTVKWSARNGASHLSGAFSQKVLIEWISIYWFYLNSPSKSLSLPIKINLASRYCDESLCERRIVSPKRNISKHVNHMRYNKN